MRDKRSNLPKLPYQLVLFLNLLMFKERKLATRKKQKDCYNLGDRSLLETIECFTVLMHSLTMLPLKMIYQLISSNSERGFPQKEKNTIQTKIEIICFPINQDFCHQYGKWLIPYWRKGKKKHWDQEISGWLVSWKDYIHKTLMDLA